MKEPTDVVVLAMHSSDRRSTAKYSLVSLLSLILAFAADAGRPASAAAGVTAAGTQRPNIVWIVGDDLGVNIGPYGASGAMTPTLDAIANTGTRFARAFAVSPTCSPSRSALITGRYPTELGTHNHRSRLAVAPRTLLDLLAAAGYQIGWPKSPEQGKTDFNFDPPAVTSGTTEWPNGIPPEPFFAYVNDMIVHEGKLMVDDATHQRNTAALTAGERQDPAAVTIPPYFPDTVEIRRSVARYGELVTVFDHNVQNLLTLLRERGVLDRTVIMIFGDHGAAFPRGKRYLYEAGIRVPLLIVGPGIEPNALRNDLVSLLDIAPTTLSLAGVKPPETMSGRALLGSYSGNAPRYVFASRDRTDEAVDRSRAVHDGRFLYIRNDMPGVGLSAALPAYGRNSPVWKSMSSQHALGALDPVQEMFFADRKAAEELYDTTTDPYQIRNLAALPEHGFLLRRMRAALADWTRAHDTLGQVPEAELMRRDVLIEPRNPAVVLPSSR